MHAEKKRAWAINCCGLMCGKYSMARTSLSPKRTPTIRSGGIMVFEEIIRSSPRRRALPRLAEGFSPTASAVERIYFSISMIPQ
jgi:hypothetical protein